MTPAVRLAAMVVAIAAAGAIWFTEDAIGRLGWIAVILVAGGSYVLAKEQEL